MRRMFFNQKSRSKKEPLDLDITSLLDVLVILLVFLLKSYNASDLKLNLVKDLVVPNSDARTLGHHAVIVQVNSHKKLFINNKNIIFIILIFSFYFYPNMKANKLKEKTTQKEIVEKEIDTKIIEFNKKTLLVVPEVHPGPFYPIGSSNLPFELYNYFDLQRVHTILMLRKNFSKQGYQNMPHYLNDKIYLYKIVNQNQGHLIALLRRSDAL